jgi:hypothetical protein
VKELAAKYGPLPQIIVECGGLERPCVADYQRTIDAMANLRNEAGEALQTTSVFDDEVRAAQMCRYLALERPLSFLGDYVIENPETGGRALEDLTMSYRPDMGMGIGTAILLSVLEHVADPFVAIDGLRDAMATGGIAIVSVPFCFPHHPGNGEDNFRFTPTGLRHVFTAPKGEPQRWEVLEADWRLDIPAEAGVLDIKTGRAQAIKSCYLVAKAVG